jgi:hypothetical protein
VLLGKSTHDPYTKIHKWHKVSPEMLDVSNGSLLGNLEESFLDSHSLLASSEFLSSVLTQEHQLFRLQRNLQSVCQNVQTFVYIRKQEDLLVSRYSTAVLSGEIRPFPNTLHKLKVPVAIDAISIIKRWHKVFGDKLTVLPFVESSSKNDLILRFLERINLERFSISDFVWPERHLNQRFSINGLEVMRQINIKFGSISRDTRYKLLEYLSTQTESEPKFTCEIDMYRSMQAHFLDTNKVLSSYLPENDRHLFLDSREPGERHFDISVVQKLLVGAISTFDLR